MRSQHARATHYQALRIMCPECHAAPGDPCTRRNAAGERVPLQGPPAHYKRMKLTEPQPPLPFDQRTDNA